MELNKLQTAWQEYKIAQGFDPITESDILEAIEEDKIRRKTQFRLSIVKYSFVYSCLMLICQSC